MFLRIKSLKSKIFLGYLLVVLILMVVTFWSINNFISLSEAIDNIMVENFRSIMASESMIESLERQDSGILMILNGHIEDGSETFKKNETEFLKMLGRAEDNITINGEEEILNKINDNYIGYLNLFEQFINLDDDEKRTHYYQEIMPFFHELKEEIRELRTINQEEMVEAQEKADTRANNAIISTTVISVFAIIIAVIFGLYLSNLILRSIKDLKLAAQEVADRNFEQKLNINSDDEIGDLAREFNKMIERLQEYEKMNINKLVAERDKSRAIVNNISSPLLVTDKENKLILLNEEAKKLFDIKNAYQETHFLEIINNDELFEIIKNVNDKSVCKNEITDSQKNIKITKNNKERFFKVSCNSVCTENEEIKYTIVLLEDVTNLKKIDEMKSDFISTVSHEFRTPLTSMNMSLNMILEGDTGSINEEQQELLEAAYEDCERLNDLVDDLLNLSKIESGEITLDFNKVDVNELIQTTINPFKNQAEEKNINLKKKKVEENIYAKADPNKVSWVISNLIGNALRYTPEGGYIEIGAQKQGRNIYLYVEDNGVGIPEVYQDEIFEKFVRGRNNEDGADGTGLGLAISKEVVEAHDGSIWVESEEGKGSKFIFSLPKFTPLTEEKVEEND